MCRVMVYDNILIYYYRLLFCRYAGAYRHFVIGHCHAGSGGLRGVNRFLQVMEGRDLAKQRKFRTFALSKTREAEGGC